MVRKLGMLAGLIGLGSLVAILATTLASSLWGRSQCFGSDQALGSLKTLEVAQAQFQALGICDQDGDGRGEYGFLQEMAGTVAPRGGTTQVAPPFVTSLLGSACDQDGIASLSSHHVVVYLPRGDGTWQRERAPLPYASPEVADAQELAWIAYAWPEAGSGPVLAVCKGSVVVESANDGADAYAGFTRIPEAGAAMSLATGSLPGNTRSWQGGDGRTWYPARSRAGTPWWWR